MTSDMLFLPSSLFRKDSRCSSTFIFNTICQNQAKKKKKKKGHRQSKNRPLISRSFTAFKCDSGQAAYNCRQKLDLFDQGGKKQYTSLILGFALNLRVILRFKGYKG